MSVVVRVSTASLRMVKIVTKIIIVQSKYSCLKIAVAFLPKPIVLMINLVTHTHTHTHMSHTYV